MKIDYKWTDGNNEDFRKFYLKTEEFYSSIVGGLKNREAFVPYNLSESISDVLIASVSGVAVGCVGLKAYSDSDVEIKRVWVDPEFRGNHISTAMMDALEQKAVELGFKRAILQTRPQMEEAVHLYTKRGYVLIDNYSPYDKLDGAICFAKELS
jgi:N-acetylglutamate synthase-like GNAT family acetyltransferase